MSQGWVRLSYAKIYENLKKHGEGERANQTYYEVWKGKQNKKVVVDHSTYQEDRKKLLNTKQVLI